MRFAAAIVLVLALAAPAVAAPPNAGVLVPGRSLGGVELGMSKAEVERRWGRAYGVCGGCPTETWYFNYFAFQPRGAGVELQRAGGGRLHDLPAPGWRTTQGLVLGDSVARITSVYGALAPRVRYLLRPVMPGRSVTTAFYALEDQLWAFGLFRPGLPLCR